MPELHKIVRIARGYSYSYQTTSVCSHAGKSSTLLSENITKRDDGSLDDAAWRLRAVESTCDLINELLLDEAKIIVGMFEEMIWHSEEGVIHAGGGFEESSGFCAEVG